MPWYPDADEAMRRVRAAMRQDNAQSRITPHQQLLQQQEQLLRQKQLLLQKQLMQLEARNQAMQLGSQIRGKRVAMRLNEQQLAEFCDVDLRKIIALEMGGGQEVSLDETLRVLQALGLQLSTLPKW